ncbi:MAG: hypothetical protein ACM3UU_05995 [Ignavibacteriales bacterium]
MQIDLVIKIVIGLILLYISYKDIKERIIPNWSVIVILCITSVWYFLNKGNILDYIFYILLISMPLLVLSYLLDTLSEVKKNIFGYLTILVSIIIAVVLPVDFKIKYITACLIILAGTILEGLIKKQQEEDEEGLSIGGGDIKLIAALGPILQMKSVVFLFISFLTAYIFMKVMKQKDIYLAPFMLIGYILILVI